MTPTPAITSLDLTDAPTVSYIISLQQTGQIGGSLQASEGMATGGNVILLPVNLGSTISALNIPANVTVTNNDFTSNDSLNVSLTSQSTTRQVVISGPIEFTPNTSAGVISVSSIQPGPVLVVGSTGRLASDGTLSVTADGDLHVGGRIAVTGSLSITGVTRWGSSGLNN